MKYVTLQKQNGTGSVRNEFDAQDYWVSIELIVRPSIPLASLE
ncbi:hypothetical protein [Priestia megaterium]|nr:hypothetical protein [Priestia megaterium]